MKPITDLADQLSRLDGRSYKAYKDVKGSYAGPGFSLHIDHVQGDPFAEPSRIRVSLSGAQSELPEWARSDAARRVSCADFLNRRFQETVKAVPRGRGSGRSGEISMLRPSQVVLVRTSMSVAADGAIEASFYVGLPADGRRILGKEAASLLGERVPGAVHGALRFASLDEAALRRHLECVEDAQALRAQLAERELVAFVADGAVLPRHSGVDDRPLADGAIAFEAPGPLAVTLSTPNSGDVTGMGVPRGITLIVGGGFHGKSTLLRAVEHGVYDHVPGDGRERVVTLPDAVKIRAEDGRKITATDISNFIANLPAGQDTGAFHTENASGSTSQAAAIMEALEVGATCLLMDEDTSATNFMIRDARMQALIADELEPITPFIDRARQLSATQQVSTVLVVGGSGDYFDVADTVIAMAEYRPREVTADAKRVASDLPTARSTGVGGWKPPTPRTADPSSLSARKGRRDVDIKIPTDDRVLYGTQEVRLSAVEQIVEVAQIRAMAETLAWSAGKAIDGKRTIAEALTDVQEQIARDGLPVVQRWRAGNLAAFRVYELAAFLNRLRSLRCR